MVKYICGKIWMKLKDKKSALKRKSEKNLMLDRIRLFVL